MTWISDVGIESLRAAISLPDFSGTRYRLLQKIGSGGMGVVWLGEDVMLARRVAVKVLDVPLESPELEERLIREARILAQLEHPGIVPVHDVGSLGRAIRALMGCPFVNGLRARRL